MLTDNGPQFAAKFFYAVCALLGVRNYPTTAYHPLTNGQTERLNRTLAQRLRHYVEEHQRDWDEYIQPLKFTYNTQVHGSTETTPFDLVLTRPPSGLALPGTVPQDAVSNTEDPQTPLQYKRATLRKLREAFERTRVKLTAAQRRYKTDFDKKVRFRLVTPVGEFVYVDRPPRQLTSTEREDLPSDGGAPSVELLPKTEGPFRVRSATGTTVVVNQNGVSNRVRVDLVTKMPRGPQDVTVAAPTPPTAEIEPEPAAEYVVDHLVDHRETRSGIQYKVRWYGYAPADDTWEPAEGLPQPFIDCFWRALAATRHH